MGRLDPSRPWREDQEVAKKQAESHRKKKGTQAEGKGPSERVRRRQATADRVVSEGPEFGRKNLVLLGLALGTIILGFITLAMGSLTLAPILLVLGYTVLVPWAILARSRPRSIQKRANSSGG